MTSETKIPKAGDVFRYSFLWSDQSASGETEGRKKRPACVTLTMIDEADGTTLLMIVPITTRPPGLKATAIEIPHMEAKRATLKTQVQWLILDEVNLDVWETSYVIEDREPLGQFSRQFIKTVRAELVSLMKAKAVQLTNRK